MTREEKQLLLKDLCARLSYITYYDLSYYGHETRAVLQEFIPAKEPLKSLVKVNTIVEPIPYENIKPYLRPMSSMTEEEKKELLNTILGEDGSQYFSVDVDGNIENTDSEYQDLNNFNLHYVNFNCETVSTYIDWLNAHHFDFRGLIEKGLALEAPEGMYEKGNSK